MKFRFEPDLDHQRPAIEAVCDLFRGQETERTEFTVSSIENHGQIDAFGSELGVGNRLVISEALLFKNLRDIQVRNGLETSASLASHDFTVEMETGTGKTYVYLRTIYELNRRYGFTKFVIVVPSVAIKEGVFKSLQMTKEHFRSLYSGVPSDFFLYDSSRLGQLRDFAASPHIRIMIVTVGAINKKDVNNLYKKDTEKTGDEAPIDLIRATHPILIVDEPQSVDGGLSGAGKSALEGMSPLCALRYSATHVDKHHMVYRLNAVDAYERKLVKQIEVASASLSGDHNRPYVRLLSIQSTSRLVTARVEIDVDTASGIKRLEIPVQSGEKLEQITGRPVYSGISIGEISKKRGQEFIELNLPGDSKFLGLGESHGSVDPLAIQREMIRRTIKEHLDKEKRLQGRGIKVLSLFFIDTVDRYRSFDEDGTPQPGQYAMIFEEEYERLRKHPDYRELLQDAPHTISDLHKGYFSVDRKKAAGRTVEVFKDTRGNTQADDDTYALIMRDKERLLDPATPLRFIFSHSALKEGWDNPNVFQVCVLRDMGSDRERRQTIGRGLRLCVGADGERIREPEVNVLTVIASESYEQFAENLQREIEQETGVRFEGRLKIRDADERRVVKTRRAILHGEEFKALWDRIKPRTTYRVEFDDETLLRSCIGAVREMPPIGRIRLQWRKADILIDNTGISSRETGTSTPVALDEPVVDVPDVLTELADRTGLTRRGLARILAESGRLHDLQRNPQEFIQSAADHILRRKRLTLVDGIKYQRIGDEYYYAQELFEEKELVGYLRNMIPTERSVYDHVIYDSETERAFAESLERNEAVKVFAKLPRWFEVPTPLGPYLPDWAVLISKDGSERLFFVVETKGSLHEEERRGEENAKLKCGEAHFEALAEGDNPARYLVETNAEDFLTRV